MSANNEAFKDEFLCAYRNCLERAEWEVRPYLSGGDFAIMVCNKHILNYLSPSTPNVVEKI
ncbi:MAG: hypothetical protein KatS3mg087_1294 [Patescibacteria group bacterium]|nr:MAG: hypothetical protein KatS3mg087_1294 [Patescibacteria group bacterium]